MNCYWCHSVKSIWLLNQIHSTKKREFTRPLWHKQIKNLLPTFSSALQDQPMQNAVDDINKEPYKTPRLQTDINSSQSKIKARGYMLLSSGLGCYLLTCYLLICKKENIRSWIGWHIRVWLWKLLLQGKTVTAQRLLFTLDCFQWL